MKLKFADLNITSKDINEQTKSISAIFSTADVDRHGEVVDQKSWNLTDFLKNPVVLFGHDHSQPPIGKINNLGYNNEGNLSGDVQFAADEYPFANVIWNLYKGGFMRAFSVGFSAGTVDVVDNQVILKDNTLYEISTVAVPANAMALAKSKGIDCSALEDKYAEIVTKNLEEKKEEEKVEVMPGDTCVCEDGGDGIVQEDGSCKPKETAAKAKGALLDEVNIEEMYKLKYENFDVVADLYYAFCNVYFDEATPVEDFSALLAEFISLLQNPPADDDSGEKNKIIAAYRQLTVEEKKAFREFASFKKSLSSVAISVKEGKVLSSKHRSLIEDSIKSLTAILEADKPSEEAQLEEIANAGKNAKSANNTEASIKVETPSVRVVVAKKSQNKTRLINKAIRALLVEKTKHYKSSK